MGNYRFKLSDMIPNAWFYKLRDMGNRGSSSSSSSSSSRSRSRSSRSSRSRGFHHPKAEAPTTPQSQALLQNQTLLPTRPSYHHSTPPQSHLPLDPPRKSARRPRQKPLLLNPTSPSPASASRRSTRRSHTYRVTSSATDITIDVDKNGAFTHLSPILTNPPPKEPPFNKAAPPKPKPRRLRTSAKSPSAARIGFSDKRARRSKTKDLGFSGSFAVVKSSWDPRKDFEESMVEMIVEKGISASADLEELLACYLALNSEEYHAVIVKVFQQIWLDLQLRSY